MNALSQPRRPLAESSARRDAAHFINGEFTQGTTGKFYDNFCPVDGSRIGSVPEGGKAEIDAAVKAARAAMEGPWGQMTLNERAALLNKVAAEINRRFDEFLEAECLDTGKPMSLASHIDIPRGAANFTMFIDVAKTVSSECFPMDTPDGKGALNYGLRRPRGVIAVISPWNLPLLLMTWKVGPALALGNTVVVKPSEATPLTATLLGEVMNTCGVPKGVYNVVHGFGGNSAGEFLTQHPGVNGITFTGSTRSGEMLMREAARGVRPVSLELGGKNPGIVFADADMDKAIEGTMRSAFANCGQVCLGTERVYVQRPIFDEFVARLKAGAEGLKLGRPEDPTTGIGPLVSDTHRKKVLSYYAKAVEQGATVVTGGGIPDMPGDLAGGAWIQPTIWTGAADDAAIVTEEIFGPCCHIRPFDTEEEVIKLANGTPYGLAAAVWTENLSRAHRVASKLEVGICWVNSWFLRDLRTAFGGAKASGIGREGGVHSLEFYTEMTNVCVKL
ncbi:2-hydroxymuconic semialdehyde dehydrogenase [Acidocella aromatica]|uniref:Aminomuconate-semialdehyde/2-hydroxymuconate-6-semialdehyde dehydrogenase n=1 Tax=Acidocella aromatica TaxID=1303579 RepID=A0A840VQ99_9PROT|nr:2-hydroxymuconic semialdehyde dehydrogenase [Acidocella aromatica]MBB5374289.1 aminomuconate-semialdehyde/2-hydroxymuconate-6-semialdehyde dehydrogenase [Acidocella aromatica]